MLQVQLASVKSKPILNFNIKYGQNISRLSRIWLPQNLQLRPLSRPPGRPFIVNIKGELKNYKHIYQL